MKHTMKSALLIAVFSCSISSIFAQTLKDVFTNSETSIFYLGIDFTQVRLIDYSTADEVDIIERQFGGINDVIVNEPKKYDLSKAFRRSYLDHDLGQVQTRNKKTNAATIKSSNTADYHRFNEDDIKKLISGFDFGGKSGIGLLFVTEAMSKSRKAIAVWVTIVDMKAKKVLMTERMEGNVNKLGGIGFKNYWAGSFKEIIDDIEKTKYSEWKSKYGN